MSKKSLHDLTDDEMRFARSSHVPEIIKEVMPTRRLESIGVETTYYQKIAARCRAEADALIAARLLKEEHGELTSAQEWREEAERLQRQKEAIEARATDAEVAERESRAEVTRLRSLPAQAVYSGSD